ncbi:hypothetical protein [Adhaeribacter pallidiroseus]|uniref:Uncharacterized protein n=1 Tax=Adhaeribacter pallidiroseus TaxID=2072847 RepID=A0A369QK98_9BACT|nr:hypothetical protein [Adhaeribacter pallidiroseus]RDC63279.1 hypothetical protein AHMF7616_01881 [Adhaeribacter pallidiroseus]
MKKVSRVYVNDKQRRFLSARQKRRGFVGGRGSGKSTVYGHRTYLNYNALARAKFFLAGLTYNQAYTKTLPSAMDAWHACGLREFDKKTGLGHYVVCQRPPAHFMKPYQAPRKYENAITFINGYTIEVLSMDRPDSGRGGNYDGGDVDESALFKREVIFKVLRPMIRGNIYRFTHYLHQSFCDYTSVPWLPSGQWVFETEENAKSHPEDYFFLESTAYDNVAVLGAGYLAGLKQEMSSIEFDVEVMNKRLKKLPNSFYPAFNEDRHLKFDTYSYQYDEETGIWVMGNNFYKPSAPLETSWDFNAAFTSMIVCQETSSEFRCVDALWKKQAEDKSLVIALTEQFCEDYAGHQCKEVLIYGDRNGNNKSAGDNKTFYDHIQETLRANGWEPTLMVEGLDPDHRLKHILINELLAETNSRLPKIRLHQDKCKFLAISIQNSPILPDWKKCKKSEGLLMEQERATHLADCFDNIVYRKYAHMFGVQTSLAGLVYTI